MKIRWLVVLLPFLVIALACNLPVGGQPAGTQTASTPVATAGVDPTSTPPVSPPVPEPGDSGNGSVFYIKEGIVHIWQEGRPVQPLGGGGVVEQVKASPDGAQVAFVRQVDEFQNELWVVKSDSGEERRLVSAGELRAIDPSADAVAVYHLGWSPDSRTLFFNTQKRFREGVGIILYDDLRQVDTGTGTVATVFSPGLGGEFTISPDGKQVALVKPDSISLAQINGSNRRDAVLRYENVLTYSEYLYYASPVWLPDSSGLAVVIPPREALAEPRQPATIWAIPANGSPARQLGSLITAPFFGAPSLFSPDLEYLAYTQQVGDPRDNQYALMIAKMDGSGSAEVFRGFAVQFVAWSPDSQNFIFSAGDPRQFYIRPVDGLERVLNEDATNLMNLQWLDATRFVYLKDLMNEQLELRLGTTGGESVLIDTITPPFLNFDVLP